MTSCDWCRPSNLVFHEAGNYCPRFLRLIMRIKSREISVARLQGKRGSCARADWINLLESAFKYECWFRIQSRQRIECWFAEICKWLGPNRRFIFLWQNFLWISGSWKICPLHKFLWALIALMWNSDQIFTKKSNLETSAIALFLHELLPRQLLSCI